MLRFSGFLLCLGAAASSTEEHSLSHGQGPVQQPACSEEQKLECGDKLLEFGGCHRDTFTEAIHQLAQVADGICITSCAIDAREICRGNTGCGEIAMRRCGKTWKDAGGCHAADLTNSEVKALISKTGHCLKCSTKFLDTVKATCALTNPETPRPTVVETPRPTVPETPAPTVEEIATQAPTGEPFYLHGTLRAADCVIQDKILKGRFTKRKAQSAVECWEKCQANKTNRGQTCHGWAWVEGEDKPCRLFKKILKSRNLKTIIGTASGKRVCHPTLGARRP